MSHAINWNHQEFQAYLLLYCAHADFIESEDEKEAIKSRVSVDTYKHIHKEFDKDNDYQRLQKIVQAVEELGYNKSEIHSLISKTKQLFFSDGDFGVLEENMFRALKRILEA